MIMPDIMMSPELEGVVDTSGVQAPVVMALTCRLHHMLGGIEGLLTSFIDIRNESHIKGFDVSVELPLRVLPEALGCREFRSIVVSLDGKTLTSRDIQSGWIQRREVLPHGSGLTLMLSVRREDS